MFLSLEGVAAHSQICFSGRILLWCILILVLIPSFCVRSPITGRRHGILLSWGGPASKIVYDIDTQNADYYFQDWWKPWTKAKLSIKNQKLLNDYMLSAYSSVIDEPEYYENKD